MSSEQPRFIPSDEHFVNVDYIAESLVRVRPLLVLVQCAEILARRYRRSIQSEIKRHAKTGKIFVLLIETGVLYSISCVSYSMLSGVALLSKYPGHGARRNTY